MAGQGCFTGRLLLAFALCAQVSTVVLMRNTKLEAAMQERGLTQWELAELLNDEIECLTGARGVVCDRTVRHWLAGDIRRPCVDRRIALEAVFECPITELGFSAGGKPASLLYPSLPEDYVKRRRFFAAAVASSAAAATPAPAARTTVGTSDVLRLRAGLDDLVLAEARRGGHDALEDAALAGAQHALDLQRDGSATERVRLRLFSVAADYTEEAAWSCIDAQQLDRAQQHLDRALVLAGLAQDGAMQFKVWNATAMLARQRGRYNDAVAAARAARTTTIARRDPLFASLAQARAAIGHACLGDRQSVLRCLGHAESALQNAPAAVPRPSWIVFYGSAERPGELHALTSAVHLRMGSPERAEAAAHRALATIPRPFRRNRAMAATHLAFAQLRQQDTELACTSAASVFALMNGAPPPGRLRTGLMAFGGELVETAPRSVAAREWIELARGQGVVDAR
jgi:tetratricopeptide (TPR) repeat protein